MKGPGLPCALSLLLCACSGGLELDAGNAFPCDFETDVATRDQACPPGWVCGLEDRCQPEAPEAFVPGAPPDFGSQVRVSPVVLDGPLRLLAGEPRLRLWLADEEDAAPPLLASVLGAGPLPDDVPPLRAAGFAASRLAFVDAAGHASVVDLPQPGARSVVLTGTALPIAEVRVVRGAEVVGADGGVVDAFLALGLSGGRAGEVTADARYVPFPTSFSRAASGAVTPCPATGCTSGTTLSGPYVDVRAVARVQLERSPSASARALAPVAAVGPWLLARVGEPQSAVDPGQWHLLNPDDPLVPAGTPFGGAGGVSVERSVLRHSEGAALWSLNYALPVPARVDSLATFLLQRVPNQSLPVLTRAWDDCAPCREGTLLAATPVTGGALGVEVLCESAGGARALWRVTGASVTSPLDACLREPVAAPFDLTALSPGAVDVTQGGALSLGGTSGQVWFGNELSSLRPLFLDRTPLAATLVTGSAGETNLAALTERAVAVQLVAPDKGGNGLTVLTLQELAGTATTAGADGADERFSLAARVEGLEDWFVLSTGDLFKTGASGGFGPRLLAPDGSPAPGPFTAVGTREGARASMVVGAADQLYYWELDPAAPLSAAPAASTLAPRLTPEPGFPIRSIARNRAVTLAGSSERDVAGWVVTSRNLFEFYRVRAGGRWALEPLSAGTEEPVELWSVGQPPAAYGRVGLRDGTVLRLPGGLPLTARLTREDGRAEQVRDYASVGGWTLALGEAGLYQAVTPGEGGKLLRWTPAPLPTGVTGAMLPGARLEVVQRAGKDALYLFTAQGFTYEVGRAP